MDFENILNTIQPFVILLVALIAAFLTAVWVSVIIWTFRDIRARSRDVFAQILATLITLLFFPLFPFPGLVLYMLLRPRSTLEEIYERSLEEEALLQGIEERMACPGCNRRIEEGFMVCPTCHTRLKKACPACGRLLHLRWNICPYCGAVQTAAKAAFPESQRVPLPVEPGVEAPRLADSILPRTQQPATEPQIATDWQDQPEWLSEPDIEADDEPTEDAEDVTGSEPESEAQAEPGDDSEPEAQTLPFEFD